MLLGKNLTSVSSCCLFRQLTKALRGSYFGFSSDNKRPVRRYSQAFLDLNKIKMLAFFRSLDSSLGVVVVPDPDPPSQQIDFKAELISLLDNQIRCLTL